MADSIKPPGAGLQVLSMTDTAQRLINWLGLDADGNGRIDGADLPAIDRAMARVDLSEREPSQRTALAAVRAVAARAATLEPPRTGSTASTLAPLYEERFARLRTLTSRAATLSENQAAEVVTLLNSCPPAERGRLAHDLVDAHLLRRLVHRLPGTHDAELAAFLVDAARGLPAYEALKTVATINVESANRPVLPPTSRLAIDAVVQETVARLSKSEAEDVFGDSRLLASLADSGSADTRALLRRVVLAESDAFTATAALAAIKGATVPEVQTLLAKDGAIEALAQPYMASEIAWNGAPALAVRTVLLDAAARTTDHDNGLAIEAAFGTARAQDVAAHLEGLRDPRGWFLAPSTTDASDYRPSVFARMARSMLISGNAEGLATLRDAAVKHVMDPVKLGFVLHQLGMRS